MKHVKKTFVLLLCAVMLFGILQAPAMAAKPRGLDNFKKVRTYEAGAFSDVSESDWYYGSVKTAYELGLMVGQGDRFGVDDEMTIAEVVTLAARLRSIYAGDNAAFAQTTPWYQAYASYLTALGLVDLSVFDMNAPATKAQFAYLIGAALPDEALPTLNRVADGAIPDVQHGGLYSSAVYRLYRAGVLSGSDELGNFWPDSNVRRCEGAAIITKMTDVDLRRATIPWSYDCTITFIDASSGSETTVYVTPGERVSRPSTPERTGYCFTGWFTSPTGGTEFNFSAPVTADATLYAHWDMQRIDYVGTRYPQVVYSSERHPNARYNPETDTWYDPATGAWYDPLSGTWCYPRTTVRCDPWSGVRYDTKTGTWYDPSTGTWFYAKANTWYDAETNTWYDTRTGAWYDPLNNEWCDPWPTRGCGAPKGAKADCRDASAWYAGGTTIWWSPDTGVWYNPDAVNRYKSGYIPTVNSCGEYVFLTDRGSVIGSSFGDACQYVGCVDQFGRSFEISVKLGGNPKSWEEAYANQAEIGYWACLTTDKGCAWQLCEKDAAINRVIVLGDGTYRLGQRILGTDQNGAEVKADSRTVFVLRTGQSSFVTYDGIDAVPGFQLRGAVAYALVPAGSATATAVYIDVRGLLR